MQDARQQKKCNALGDGKVGYMNLVAAVMPQGHLHGTLPSGQSSSSGALESNLGWSHSEVTPPATTQSRSTGSSTVLSPGDGDTKTSSGSSDQSGSVLKEHDYIGLAEVSSASVVKQQEQQVAEKGMVAEKKTLKLEETDLRLGLGPPDASHSSGMADTKLARHSGFQSSSLVLGSNSNQSAPWVSEQKQGDSAMEKTAYTSYDHLPARESSSRLPSQGKSLAWPERSHGVNQSLGLASQEKSERQVVAPESQCPSVWPGCAPTDNALDKRPPILPDISASQNLWHAQVLRNMEGIRVPSTLDFSSLQVPLSGQEYEAARSAVLNCYAGQRVVLAAGAAAKNGVKRGYAEAMADKRFNHGEIRNGLLYDSVACPAGAAQTLGPSSSVGVNGLQAPEAELKHFSHQTKHQPPPFVYNWAPGKPPDHSSWQVGVEQASGSFGPFQSLQNKTTPGRIAPHSDLAVDSPAVVWETRSKTSEGLLPADNSHSAAQQSQPSGIENQQSTDAPPPQKGQVIGWPPIRSFRKNTLAAHPKPSEDGEGSGNGPEAVSGHAKTTASSLYVKVNMDGVPIGRKVDLNAHKSYEALTLALEEMFPRSNAGQGGTQVVSGKETVSSESKQLRLINGSDYVLTYEDKEGDMMLVGDVPWVMFVNTVRRLRIMKGSEATGLAPRGSRNQNVTHERQEFHSRLL